MSGEREGKGRWTWLLLGLVALAGFWLRWRYARDVPFFVDEYLTVRAAERILARGIPLLPSGNFYSHGLLLSYLVAPLLALGARAAWLIRLPVLLLSTGAILLTGWFGRRTFSAAAGLLAAALLAFAPEAILWGGRVRMYGPLQFFALLATVLFYLWVVEEQDRPAYRLLFVLAYWASLFSHAEAMLLLPLWGLWALAQRGWRWVARPANLAAFALSGVAPAIEILLRRIGPPVQARVAPGTFAPLTREYLSAAVDWPGVLKVVEPLFLTPQRLPLVVLALGGLAYLLLSLARRRALPPAGRPAGGRALAYLLALLLPVLFLLLFVVDPDWKSPRYGLMLLPHFFLVASAAVVWLGRWLGQRLGLRRPLLGEGAVTILVVLIALASWPGALAATRESVPAYDRAFAYVEAHRQPGDVVVTFLCPAAFWHLGDCDYLAAPDDFAGFAIEEEGRWVSGWDRVPIVDTGAGLAGVLAEAPRVWFVVDEGRFAGRYEDEFLAQVWQGMELVAAEQEVLVFLSREEPLPPPQARLGHEFEFEGGLRLLGYTARPEAPAPGDDLALTLYWQADAWIPGSYTVFVHLLDGEGERRGQDDAPPLGGLYPTSHWPPGVSLPDSHLLFLPPDLDPGRYRLVVGLYDAVSLDRLPLAGGAAESAILDYLWLGRRPPEPAPVHEVEVVYGGAIRLSGYDLSPEPASAGDELALTLYWQRLAPVDEDYIVFVHLVDGSGEIAAQGDGPPLGGAYPTSYWQPGETLVDGHRLDRVLPAGRYRLLVGLYTLPPSQGGPGSRLPVTAGPDTGADGAILATIEVR
ncbi:MAG: glycosyltransferase family 39 protein [Anaerolineae bacterium]